MIRMRKLGVIAGVIAAVGISAPVSAQSLEETLARSYEENPTLRSERARLRATDERVSQALSNWRPTVSVSGSYGWERNDATITGPQAKEADITEPLFGSLTIRQNLYRGGRTKAATEEAENNVKADRARLSALEQLVLLNATTAYADVVRDQAVLDLNNSNERVLLLQLEATQDRFRVGEVTRTDVSLAESRLSRARADRIAAEGSLTGSRASYENVVGEVPGVLKVARPLSDLPKTLAEAVELAKTNNFNVRQTGFIQRAAENNVQEIAGELLPTFSFNGSLTTNEEAVNRKSDSQTLAVTARVSMPLYSSGNVSSRVREAKQIVSQRRDEYSQAVRDATEAATSAWQAVETGRAQIQAFSAAVKAAEIALEGVREEANVGSRTVLDVLDAEQELLDARVGLVRALRDELVATYQLRQVVGELTAKALGLPVALYNVETNYRRVRNKWWGLGIDKE